MLNAKVRTIISYGLFCWSISFLPTPTHGQAQRCGTEEWLHTQALGRPELLEERANVQKKIQQWIASNPVLPRNDITVPVVVHVVWHEIEEDISDAQIESQINILNQDFKALNEETSTIPNEFMALVADIGIEFCLAKIDEQGNPTNGITRTFTPIRNIGNNPNLVKFADRGGADAWNTEKYINIWIAKRTDGFLGIATAPSEFSSEEDGLVIDYTVFGNIELAAQSTPYHLGRTTTHEMGHFFGLQHLWGRKIENSDCMDDDHIADTPTQRISYNNRCPTTPQFSCGSSDMYMNFMNYTNDACMGMFTLGQKAVMLATLFELRTSLIGQNLCEEKRTSVPSVAKEQGIRISPNPVRTSFQIIIEQPINIQRIFVTNGMGQICFVQHFPMDNYFDVSHLPSGIYSVFVQTSIDYWSSPLIIIK